MDREKRKPYEYVRIGAYTVYVQSIVRARLSFLFCMLGEARRSAVMLLSLLFTLLPVVGLCPALFFLLCLS